GVLPGSPAGAPGPGGAGDSRGRSALRPGRAGGEPGALLGTPGRCGAGAASPGRPSGRLGGQRHREAWGPRPSRGSAVAAPPGPRGRPPRRRGGALPGRGRAEDPRPCRCHGRPRSGVAEEEETGRRPRSAGGVSGSVVRGSGGGRMVSEASQAQAVDAARTAGELRRARLAVLVYFFVAGVVLATWASRIPDVKAQVGIGDGELSLGLLGLAVGALAAMQVAGRVTDRFGSAALVVPAAVLGSLSLAGPGHAHTLPALFAALFALGAGHGMIDVPMNVHAARVERAYGRPIMASFHAAFSIGGFAGAGIGALSAFAGIGPVPTFWTVALVLAAVSVAARSGLLPGADTAPAAPRDGAAPGTGP